MRLEQYNEARRKAQELMQCAQQSWVKHRDTPKYQVRDQVWLEGRHLHANQPTAKLASKRHSPFKVVQVMSPVNYRLGLPTQWSIHDVFHTDLLTPYRETITHGTNYQCPPPDLVDGVEEYEVKKVLDSHRYGRGRKLQYLVAWKGYPDSDNQWVNWDDAEGAQEAIREFKRLNPDREAHIKASIIPSHSTSPTRICSMSTSPSLSASLSIGTLTLLRIVLLGMSSRAPPLTSPLLSPMATITTSTMPPPTMTTVEVDKALASIATSSMPRPLLEMWKSQRPTFQLPQPSAIVTTAQADPPFWKTVVNTWADDFLFRAYI
jgi:hypothetical protein